MKKDKYTDQLGQRIRAITAELKLYFEKRLELKMLNIGEFISGWLAASIQRATGAILLLGGVCFLLVALAIFLGNVLENESLGYVLVSLPLLLAGGLFMYLKPRGVFEQLQQRFEVEVIKAIEQDGKARQKKINSAEMKQSETIEDK